MITVTKTKKINRAHSKLNVDFWRLTPFNTPLIIFEHFSTFSIFCFRICCNLDCYESAGCRTKYRQTKNMRDARPLFSKNQRL